MPWVNRNGSYPGNHTWDAPDSLTEELRAALRARGYEWVAAVTGMAHGNPVRMRQEYARRWATERADQDIRQAAARARQRSGTIGQERVAGRSRGGVWVNGQGVRWEGRDAETPPDVLEARERDLRVAAGFRWLNHETYAHPTLRRNALDGMNQDGEVDAARERLVHAYEPTPVPTWVNRHGERRVPSPGTTDTRMVRDGWHQVEALADEDAEMLAARWLDAEVRHRLRGQTTGATGAGASTLRGYLWVNRAGDLHPTFRNGDGTASRRTDLENAGWRRTWLELPDGPSMVTRGDLAAARARQRSGTIGQERVAGRSRGGVWVNGQGVRWEGRDAETPPDVLEAAGYRWVEGPAVRDADADTLAGMWQEADRIRRQTARPAAQPEVIIHLDPDPDLVDRMDRMEGHHRRAAAEALGVPQPVPAYVEVAPPISPRGAAWNQVLDHLLEAMAALPAADPAGDRRSRYTVAAELGGLINRAWNGNH